MWKIVLLHTVVAMLVSFSTVMLLVAVAQPPKLGYTTKGRVVRVVDGDTVEVEIRKIVTVRLLNCWAPESRTTDKAEKAKGLAAKGEMQRLVGGGECVLHVPTGGKESWISLGRVLGEVWMAGEEKSLSQQMVEGGFATVEKGK